MFSKVCKKCNVEFTTKKREQTYCSKSCANSVNQAKKKIEDNSIFKYGLDETNAYILGLIYSDGCLSYDKHTQKYRITIAMNENKLMEQIRVLMTPSKKLYTYKHPKGKDFTYSVVSTNKEDIMYLMNLGVTERKSLTVIFPNINKDFLSHFIRGYFDGDGSIYCNTTTTYYRNNIKKYYYTNVSFTTGSTYFAIKLKDILIENDIKCSMVKDSRSNNNSWYIKIYNIDDVYNFYNFIYKNAHFYLERKYSKFIEMI